MYRAAWFWMVMAYAAARLVLVLYWLSLLLSAQCG